MQSASRSRFSIYSSRLHPRRPLDVRVCLLAIDANGEWLRLYGRTRDLSLGGACLTLPCMLPRGREVALQLRLPRGESFAIRAIVIRRQGSRLGVRFLETSAAQRMMLAAYCRG